MNRVVEEIKAELRRDSVSGTSHIATGNMLANTRAEIIVHNNNRTEVVFGYFVPYGVYFEKGTKPHSPPFPNIKAWAHLKGGGDKLAGAAWRTIQKKGTTAYPILERVWRKERNNYRNKVNRRVRNALR